jgi:hypothetical protein
MPLMLVVVVCCLVFGYYCIDGFDSAFVVTVDFLLLLLQGQFCFFFFFSFCLLCHVLYVPFLNQYIWTSEIVVHLITKNIFILYSFLH